MDNNNLDFKGTWTTRNGATARIDGMDATGFWYGDIAGIPKLWDHRGNNVFDPDEDLVERTSDRSRR